MKVSLNVKVVDGSSTVSTEDNRLSKALSLMEMVKKDIRDTGNVYIFEEIKTLSNWTVFCNGESWERSPITLDYTSPVAGKNFRSYMVKYINRNDPTLEVVFTTDELFESTEVFGIDAEKLGIAMNEFPIYRKSEMDTEIIRYPVQIGQKPCRFYKIAEIVETYKNMLCDTANEEIMPNILAMAYFGNVDLGKLLKMEENRKLAIKMYSLLVAISDGQVIYQKGYLRYDPMFHAERHDEKKRFVNGVTINLYARLHDDSRDWMITRMNMRFMRKRGESTANLELAPLLMDSFVPETREFNDSLMVHETMGDENFDSDVLTSKLRIYYMAESILNTTKSHRGLDIMELMMRRYINIIRRTIRGTVDD